MNKVNWKDLVYYDPTSPSGLRWACNIPHKGTFGNKVSYVKVVGDVAGSLQKKNNRYKIKYQQKAYMAHRVVYELFYGKISDELVVDHIDGDALNNRIENLRVVEQAKNARNVKKHSRNTTGVVGVVLSVVKSSSGKVFSYYNATWQVEGKMQNKYFSITKLGEDEAFRLACEHRAKMIEELNKQGAGYTERHGT